MSAVYDDTSIETPLIFRGLKTEKKKKNYFSDTVPGKQVALKILNYKPEVSCKEHSIL